MRKTASLIALGVLGVGCGGEGGEPFQPTLPGGSEPTVHFLETFDDGDYTTNPEWTSLSVPNVGEYLLDASAGALHIRRRISGGLPDLTPTYVAGPASGAPGQSASVTVTAQNIGTGSISGGWLGEIRLSMDQVCTSDVRDPDALVYTETNSLDPGASTTATRTATIPASIAPATYYWCVILDPAGGTVAESNEANNALIGNQVTISGGSALSLSQTVGAGDFITSPTWTSAHVLNLGDQLPNVSTEVLQELQRVAGASGESLDLGTPVDIAVTTTTIVVFDVMVDESSVPGCGTVCTEYPVNVALELELSGGGHQDLWLSYNDDGGNTQVYPGGVGFSGGPILIVGRGDAPQHIWLRGETHVIRSHVPDAVRITGIRLFGAGWDFEGWFDNIRVEDP